MDIWKEQLGPKHALVAALCFALGTVYNNLGELERAKEYHLLALEIRKEKLGSKHIGGS